MGNSSLDRRRRIWALALVLMCGHLVVPCAVTAETVKGQFVFLDYDQTLRPIAYSKVEVWSFRPRFLGIWGWGREAEGATDESGFFMSNVKIGVKDAVVAVRVIATNYAAVVWFNSDWPQVQGAFWAEPKTPSGQALQFKVQTANDVFDFSSKFEDEWTAQHFNLAETVRLGRDFILSKRDPAERDRLPRASVQPTGWTGSWYNPGVERLHQTIVINRQSLWDDFTILHEFAHFVEEELSSFAWIPSLHDGCYATDLFGAVVNSPEHAWMEGFADWLPRVMAQQHPGVFSAGGFFVRGYEVRWDDCPEIVFGGLTRPPAPDAYEWRIAAVLWDLFDAPSDAASVRESFDGLQRMDNEIVQILDRDLDIYGRWPTIQDFHDAWIRRGLDHLALDRIMWTYDIVPKEDSGDEAPYSSEHLGDFDGDGRSDRTIVDPRSGRWYVLLSSREDPQTVGIPWGWQWGGMGSHHRLALGDYDGDARTDRAIVDPSNGRWYVLLSSGADAGEIGIPWGWQWGGMGSHHRLALGDYDGDGRTDRAIVDPNNGRWYVLLSSGADASTIGIPWGWQWGGMGGHHRLAFGDYDGDGRTDRAIVDPNNGRWYVLLSSGADAGAVGIPWGWQWGGMGSHHRLALGDYDGDARTDRAIVDPSNGRWYVLLSSGADAGTIGIPWGWQWGGMGTEHHLALGDYDGDGRTDRAIIDPDNGRWFVLLSGGADASAVGVPWGDQIAGMNRTFRVAYSSRGPGMSR